MAFAHLEGFQWPILSLSSLVSILVTHKHDLQSMCLEKNKLQKQYVDPSVCVSMRVFLKKKTKTKTTFCLDQENPVQNGSYYGCCLVANSTAIPNSLSHCNSCSLNLTA